MFAPKYNLTCLFKRERFGYSPRQVILSSQNDRLRLLRSTVILAVVCAALSGCEVPLERPALGPDGLPLPAIYRINDQDIAKIQFRMLDSVNALRTAAGRQAVTLNNKLTAAAATHALDMSVQNRPWHFGSDGSSPVDRVQRVSYAGTLIGEVISETYETELQTLKVWIEEDGPRSVILDPMATELGFAWHQEASGKIWWTLVMGFDQNTTREL